MPKSNVGTPCCEETVNVLIANENTRFTEDDREFLLAQDEATLSKFFPKEAKKEPVQVNKEQVMQVLKESISKPEDFISFMPDEYKDQMKSGLALHRAMRKEMVDKIMSNSEEGTWDEKELNAMDTAMLKKIASYVKEPVDYSINGGTPPLNTLSEEDVLVLPGTKLEGGK